MKNGRAKGCCCDGPFPRSSPPQRPDGPCRRATGQNAARIAVCRAVPCRPDSLCAACNIYLLWRPLLNTRMEQSLNVHLYHHFHQVPLPPPKRITMAPISPSKTYPAHQLQNPFTHTSHHHTYPTCPRRSHTVKHPPRFVGPQ